MMVDAKNEKMKQSAMLIRQELQEVGIGLKILLYRDEADVNRYVSTGKAQAHLTFFPGADLDPNEAVKIWFSNDKSRGKVWVYKELDPRVDELILSGRSGQDRKARQAIYRRLHELIYQEQPACFLYFPYMFHAASKRIRGTEMFLGSAHMPDYSMKDFYILDEQ